MSSSASASSEGSVPLRASSPPKSYLSYFEDQIPWTEEKAQEIQNRRALLNDELVFDTLLYQVGVRDADVLFPPTDSYGLERLVAAIETSTYDQMKKDGLVYYLLKWREDSAAQDFMHERGIFPQFVILADAYWELDAGRDIKVCTLSPYNTPSVEHWRHRKQSTFSRTRASTATTRQKFCKPSSTRQTRHLSSSSIFEPPNLFLTSPWTLTYT
jgi:hypothetical protein